MDKYKGLLKHINSQDVELMNDKDFIISIIVKHCIQLFDAIEQITSTNYTSAVFPYLRQIYEYTLVILGLLDDIISIDDFVKQSNKNNIFNHIFQQIENKNKNMNDVTFIFLRRVKEYLNIHNHASFEKFIRTMIEMNSDTIVQKTLQNDLKYTILLLEALFIPTINAIYSTDIAMPSIDDFRRLTSFSHFDKTSKIEIENYNRLIRIESIREKIEEIRKSVQSTNKDLIKFTTKIN